MRILLGLGKNGLSAALAALALFIYVAAPILHGLVHADHEIQAALKASSVERTGSHHTPAPHQQDQDCALFKLYAGHGGHALAPSAGSEAVQLLMAAETALLRLDPLPAGAPRGFALGRGPPHIA